MIRIAHVLDATATWETRVALLQLADRLPRDRFAQAWIAIDPLPGGFSLGFDHPVTPCPRRFGLALSAAPSLSRALRSFRADVVHAWGVDAASVAATSAGVPLLVTQFDPLQARRGARLLRTLDERRPLGVACSAETVRRRLIEQGLRPDAGVVIRPGVDFSRVNAARRGGLRERLGCQATDVVVTLPAPPSRDGGHFDAVFAASLVGRLMGNVRVIVPGVSRERDRIERFTRRLPGTTPPIFTGDDVPMERIIAVSDALIVAARGDVSTTAVAWAMAAGAAVIGAADYALAELIATRLNGLLFKRPRERRAVVPIARLLRDRDAQLRVREVARGQAYEVFSVRRFADQHIQCYHNMLGGLPAGNGIADAARTG